MNFSLDNDLYHAVDTQNEQLLGQILANPFTKSSRPSKETCNACFSIAAAFENVTILNMLFAANYRPTESLLNKTFEQEVCEGIKPELIYCLQHHVSPTVLATARREQTHTVTSAHYVVDLIEPDMIKKFESKLRQYSEDLFSKSRSVQLNALLRGQAWINELLIDSAQMQRKLMLSRLLQLNGPIIPSQNAVNTAFRQALFRDQTSIAYLLCAGGDHASVSRNKYSCVDINGYNEAFEYAADTDDYSSILFLLNGRVGFRPDQALIDMVYFEREVANYIKTLGEREGFHRPRTTGEDDPDIQRIQDFLHRHVSPECMANIFAEKQRLRQAADQSGRQRRLFMSEREVDIHSYAGTAVPVAETGASARPDDGRRGRTPRNTLNDAILANIESRLSALAAEEASRYDIPSMTRELTDLIMLTFSTEAQQREAVGVIGAVLHQSSLSIFARTLTFLKHLHPRDASRTSRVINTWMEGFLSESIVMHSCNPGALERVVTGLRGIGDQQLDSIFGQAEGPHLARSFLKGTFNIFFAERDTEERHRAETNARSMSVVLVHRYSITAESTRAVLMEALVDYARRSLESYGVNVDNYMGDINAIVEMICDSYETHLEPFLREELKKKVDGL